MRILIVTTDFLPNVSGIATLCYEQAAGLASAGHHVHVLTTTAEANRFTVDNAFTVEQLAPDPRPIIRLQSLYKALSATLRSHQFDFIWCANYRGFGLPVYMLARRHHIPYGLYIHGTELVTEAKSTVRRLIFSRVAKNAGIIITNSHFTANLLRSKFKLRGHPVTPGVYPPPTKSEAFEQKSREIRNTWLSQARVDNPVVFISSCRITPEKGLHLVLQAISQLPPPLRNRILYVIGGSGTYEQELRNLTASLKITPQVFFNGTAPREDLPSILRAADVYIQPSQPQGDYIEGFGISFLEAQAAGLPCIASDWAGTPEAITRDITGILVPTGSSDAIASAITRAIEDEPWRSAASREAIQWATGNSWTNHVKSLEPFLTTAANSHHFEKLP